MRYSEKFKSRMISKLLPPNARSAVSLSKEVGVSQATLSRWLRDAKLQPMTKNTKTTKSKRRRSPDEKVRVVMEATALSGEELGAFLRREGLHDADLEELRADVTEAASEGLRARRSRGTTAEQKKIRQLERELDRKEKALAEAAALLVLRANGRPSSRSAGKAALPRRTIEAPRDARRGPGSGCSAQAGV
jgi:transposase